LSRGGKKQSQMLKSGQQQIPYRIIKSSGIVTGIALISAAAGIASLENNNFVLASAPGLFTAAWILQRAWPIAAKNPPLELGVTCEIRKSPGAGLGLFAKKDIKRGTFLFDYLGEEITEDEFEQRYGKIGAANYGLELYPLFPWQKSTLIDAIDPAKSNAGRYMNHAFPNSPLYNVVKRRQRWPIPALRLFAARDIKAGEELCWNYGQDYWRGRENMLRQHTTHHTTQVIIT